MFLDYEIIQIDPEDPFSVKMPDGNLLGRYSTLKEAKRAICENRLRALVKEMQDIMSLPEYNTK